MVSNPHAEEVTAMTPTAPYDARTVARWLIEWARFDEEGAVSNLKLQKLLYYAQGHYMAAHDGEPLFKDQIQAWSHGPVVPDVYHAYKQFKSGPIVDESDFDFDCIDREAAGWLASVWRTFGSLSAWKLREMTHDESPWRSTFREDGRHIVIDHDAMMEYFQKFHHGSARAV